MTAKETSERTRSRAQRRGEEADEGPYYISQNDMYLKRKIARARRWELKRRRRSRVEQKRNAPPLQEDVEQKDVSDELSSRSSSEEVGAAVQASYVSEALGRPGGLLAEAAENVVAEDGGGVVSRALEGEQPVAEASSHEVFSEEMGSSGRYLYGVVSSGEAESFGAIGLGGSEVYTVPFRDVSALVSSSPMRDYELSEENAMKHQEVIRRVMEGRVVVPAEFGTVVKDEAVLRSLLAGAYSAVSGCIRLIDGKVELGVKAILKRDQNLTPVEKDDVSKSIISSLRDKAEQQRNGDLFSSRLIVNASFLVEKKHIDKFSEEVGNLREKYADKLGLLYSGPWAPYNFIHIKIGAGGIGLKTGQ